MILFPNRVRFSFAFSSIFKAIFFLLGLNWGFLVVVLAFLILLFVLRFDGRPRTCASASMGNIPSQAHLHRLHEDPHLRQAPTLHEQNPMFPAFRVVTIGII